MKMIESHEAFVGALVVWLHTPRGGYGYIYPVDAKICALNLQGDKAKIEVAKKSGETVFRNVNISSLRWPNRRGGAAK
jgi:hypothetical protein